MEEKKTRPFSEGGFKKYIQRYEEVLDEKTGKTKIIKSDKEQFYKIMQEQTEGQLLDTLLERYKVNINDKKITQLKDEIIDMTGIPDNAIEIYAKLTNAKNAYNEVPAFIKEHYKDFGGYLNALMSGQYKKDLDTFKRINKKEPTVPDKEPTTQKKQQEGVKYE